MRGNNARRLLSQAVEAADADEWWRVALLAIQVVQEAVWLYKQDRDAKEDT